MRQMTPVWKRALTVVALAVLSGCGSGAVNENGALLTSIVVSSETSTMDVGATRQFTAIGQYDDNTSEDISNKVIWTSSDPSTATITAGGLATAVNKGTTTIMASLAYVAGAAPLTITIIPATAQWVHVDKVVDGPYSEYYSVATSTDGSLYAAGSLWLSPTTTHDFGNGVTTAVTATVSGYTGVLTKYDSSSNAQWTKTPGAGATGFSCATVAPDGSVLAAGSTSGNVDFGDGVTTTKTSTYGGDIVLVKYDSSGTARWAKTIAARPSGSGDGTVFTSVAVAPDGSVYAVGTIGYYYSAATITVSGIYDFGDDVTVTGPFAGRDNSLLVKYDSSGKAQWARAVAAGSGGSAFNGVTVASDGSVYAAGYLIGTGTYNFGNGISAAGGLDGRNSILVKYDSAGAAQWAATVQAIPGTTGGVSGIEFSGASVAPDGSVFAAGTVLSSGYIDFGNGVTLAKSYSIPASDSSAAVLVKYDPSGTAQWARTVASDENILGVSAFSGVSVASDGSVYTTGALYGFQTFDFGNDTTMIGTYYSRIILVKYSASGTTQWVNTMVPGANSSWGYGVSAASDGSVFASGWISGNDTFDFGNNVTATGNSVENFLLVKFK